jgi:hypothetical protein
MRDLVHEKLDVYRTSFSFLATVDEILTHLPRGKGHLGDQLDRELLVRIVSMLTRMVLDCAAETAKRSAPASTRTRTRTRTHSWHVTVVRGRAGRCITCSQETRRDRTRTTCTVSFSFSGCP